VYLEHRILRESVKRYLLKHSVARIFVHSPSLAERLKKYGLNPLCLPRHINTESFPFVPLDPASQGIVFVGYLDDVKGVEHLIEAFQIARKKVPEARLDIVGNGPGRVRYREMAAGLEQYIHFHGEIAHNSVASFYQNAAMVVIPSQVPETGPFTALEALSTGRPVVASNCGGLAEIIVEGVTGYLVDPYDIKGMAERMIWLLEHPATASELGAHGRALIEDMALKDPFPMIEAEYVDLMERKRAGVSRKGIA
jgi:glycosyltransferase involved in cell wall biosynthesis